MWFQQRLPDHAPEAFAGLGRKPEVGRPQGRAGSVEQSSQPRFEVEYRGTVLAWLASHVGLGSSPGSDSWRRR